MLYQVVSKAGLAYLEARVMEQGPEHGCGTWDAACPSCGGMRDTRLARSGWTASAIGHRAECLLAARISTLEAVAALLDTQNAKETP